MCFGAGLAGCSEPERSAPQPSVGQTAAGIRNGTREPQIVPLSEGQLLALGWLHPNGRPGSNFCTGTLIAPNVVATAEHCVTGRSARGMHFSVGQFPEEPAGTWRVAQIIPHPRVDAALLVLAKDATEALPELVPIEYNKTPLTRAFVGREVEAAGFGDTYDETLWGRFFAVVELVQVGRNSIVVDGRGRQGICFGDSGGPSMTINDAGDPVVLAVESSGDSSCVGRDTMTRLDTLADWIDPIIAGDLPESACGEIDFLGTCEGLAVVWCDGGELNRRDCGARGEICEYLNDDSGYWCSPAPPCGDIDALGQCDGSVVQRCRFGTLFQEDCGLSERFCTVDLGGAYCAADEPVVEPAPEPDMGVDEPADAGVDDEADAELVLEDDAAIEIPKAADAGIDDESARTKSGSCSTTPGSDAPSSLLFMLPLAGLLARRRRLAR